MQLPPLNWNDGMWYYQTVTTNTTNVPDSEALEEERVRQIVREEIAEILPIDVPDTPPEDLTSE